MSSESSINKDKWSVWVGLAWIVAVATIIVSGVMISKFGTVEVPTPLTPGYPDTKTNYLVVGAAIGQSLGAIFLAVIMSMIDSIYKNSCDHLLLMHNEHVRREEGGPNKKKSASPTTTKVVKGDDDSPVEKSESLQVESVKNSSPLGGLIEPGYMLKSVNGKAVTTEEEVHNSLVSGNNEFAFITPKGKHLPRYIEMQPGPLGIQFR